MSLTVNRGFNHNSEKVFVPATESQQEVWISCLLGGDDASRSYNLSVTLNLSGELNRNFLEQSIQDLVNRHEALRSVFTDDASQVCIFSEFKPVIYFEDTSSNNEQQRQAIITKYIKEDTNTVFDLLNGPLYKLSLFYGNAKIYFENAVGNVKDYFEKIKRLDLLARQPVNVLNRKASFNTTESVVYGYPMSNEKIK